LKSRDHCGVCGTRLVYEVGSTPMTCVFCNQISATNTRCPEGHYVCDTCHGREALEILRGVVDSSKSTIPVDILEITMSHASVPMHGPEHHAMVPAAIVTAVKNAGHSIPELAIETAIDRGAKIPGGWCGFFGACGAAVGVGVAVSVLTEATPLTGRPRSLAMAATSYALSKMADGYPRCCKRASRQALEAAIEFLRDRMGIDLPKSGIVSCTYSHRNPECPRDGCSYFVAN
jgi:hypothetical protein